MVAALVQVMPMDENGSKCDVGGQEAVGRIDEREDERGDDFAYNSGDAHRNPYCLSTE